MIVGRVVGQMIPNLKHRDFEGRRLLVVDPERVAGLDGGRPSIAVDLVGADVGERVLLVDDGAAARGLLGKSGPIRTMIVGVVDEVHIGTG